MIRLALLPALLLAASPGLATRPDDQAAFQAYVRARAADAAGEPALAAAGYAAALAAAPGDPMLAMRTYRQALAAGDRPLALAAARTLEAAGALPPDGRLLFVADALLTRDWAAARTQADAIEKDGAFGFTAPILRAWIDFGAKAKNPIATLDSGGGSGVVAAYSAEQRALLLIATKRYDEGIAAIRAQSAALNGRAIRLRLAAAATLQKRGKRDLAASLLDGADPALGYARQQLAKRARLPAPVLTPADAIAELFARLAVDINRERVTPLALNLARLATFLAPNNAETWLVTSELLAAADQPQGALSALAHVAPDDPFIENVRIARFQLLVRQGERDEALGEAQAVTARADATPADWVRVGDILSDMDDHPKAAAAYGRAVALAEADPAQKDAMWTFLLLQGGALEQAKDWPAAKPALERAAQLAPDQAVVLNYLGYAQLERRENLEAAESLIERASKLRPDDASITDSLGWAYYIRGKIPQAIDTLERAAAGDPGEPTINEHLGDAYWAAGRRVDARYAWRAALVHAERDAATRIKSKIDAGLTVALAAP